MYACIFTELLLLSFKISIKYQKNNKNIINLRKIINSTKNHHNLWLSMYIRYSTGLFFTWQIQNITDFALRSRHKMCLLKWNKHTWAGRRRNSFGCSKSCIKKLNSSYLSLSFTLVIFHLKWSKLGFNDKYMDGHKKQHKTQYLKTWKIPHNILFS